MNKTKNWTGKILSIQPRIRLLRAYDESSKVYLGYILLVEEEGGTTVRVGIKKSAVSKHQLQAGDRVSGTSTIVKGEQSMSIDLYKTDKLTVLNRGDQPQETPPPWIGVPPSLTTYRERGCQRLDPELYEKSCAPCVWGCQMITEISLDPYKRSLREYRMETYCYGPLSCSIYKPGPRRLVPRNGKPDWEEPDSVDQQSVAHRNKDE